MRQQRELWLGRGSFDQLSAIVRRQTPIDAEWRRVRYMIFELPNAPGSFADRVEQIKATPVPFARCGGLTDALRRNPPPVGR